ncbi:MAG TPA: hypothetical protein VFO78_05700 [Candidatus Limnocylindrales bacterium]|nr:hypothetical protein [Candidatus Limnocylindrales bacterium]
MKRTVASTSTLIAVSAFILAFALGTEIARPVRGASVAFDSQVAVLDWHRMTSGQTLETYVTTTSKPLLTVVFGALHAVTADWRTLSWATILVFAAGVAGAAELTRRAAGTAAGVAVGVGLAGSGSLLFDVGHALATPWALAGWAAAGLLIARSAPRYGLAGIALLLATLARLETVVLVGGAVLALLAAGVARMPHDRRAWQVPLIALGAIPVMCVHDFLLVGDPFMWVTVSARYSAVTDLDVLSPFDVVLLLLARLGAMAGLALLAIVGTLDLIRRPATPARTTSLVAILSLGPAMAFFLVVLAARGTFVSERYLAAIDIAVVVAAGIGLAAVALVPSRVADRDGDRSPASNGRGGALTAAVAAGIAVALVWPGGWFSRQVREPVANSLTAAADLERILPVLEEAIGAERAGGRTVTLAVPGSIGPRIAIDLDVPLTSVTDTGRLEPADLVPGLLVLHHRRAERRPDAASYLEIEGPATVDGVRIDRVGSDQARGWWVIRVVGQSDGT